MASIKVSELPAVSAITPLDVLIINDEDATTSKITISDFTSSFIGQTLPFTGIVSFGGVTTFGVGSVPTFGSDTTFNQRVTFNGPITLGSLAQIPLGSLSDVTLPGSITDGNVLTWDNANSYWTSAAPAFSEVSQDTTPTLGGNLDTNNFDITGPADANIEVAPVGTGKFVVKGETTAQVDASITLNCYTNGHGVTIKSPPHSAAAVYTFILPVSMGANQQFLMTNGTDQTSWVTVTPALIGAATSAQGATADSAMQVAGPNVIPAYADDAAAAAGGVAVGGLYRIGSAVQVRVS